MKVKNGFVEKVTDWNSSRQSWEETKDSELKNLETSSGDESPPSDIPASSSVSNTIGALDFFIQAIDKNELNEKPDLETQLKILRWMRNCSSDNVSLLVRERSSN
uniref:BESS domain-containing protein n=1 Tax=Syphacia muris TaxID=451379 RepID=A0A0N5AQD7_9BILA